MRRPRLSGDVPHHHRRDRGIPLPRSVHRPSHPGRRSRNGPHPHRARQLLRTRLGHRPPRARGRLRVSPPSRRALRGRQDRRRPQAHRRGLRKSPGRPPQAGSTPSPAGPGEFRLTWDDLKALAARGFEISSHTITHPRLAVLDDANLDYELGKSRQDILDHLGPKHTFTVECPFGTEDERVIRHALALYPASRNRLPEPFLDELNRSSEKDPAASSREYVQWQRGALTATPMSEMKGWVDTILRRDNIWLVLVFHGVDGIGWEPKTGAELDEYFGSIKSLESRIWVASFPRRGEIYARANGCPGDNGPEREIDRSRPPSRPDRRDLRPSSHLNNARAVRLAVRRRHTGRPDDPCHAGPGRAGCLRSVSSRA